MASLAWIGRLGRNDVRLILRDRMLLMLLSLVVLIGVAARYAFPAIDAALARNGVLPSATTALRFADLYPLFVAFIGLWQAALMPGTCFGFLLLDEKEDGTLTALRVTPLPIERYVAYRVTLPALLGFAFALALPPLMGQATLPLAPHLALAAGAAVTAPLVTLLLAIWADNKVQGLAYTKIAGVLGLAILAGYFAPTPAQWLIGVFPPFLVCKAYWMALADTPLWWVPLIIATAAQLAILAVLVRRFRTDAFR